MTDKTDAWMPLWIGAYLADTQMLTTLQHGAYLLLLMAYWRERSALPDDDDALRSIAKADKTEWKKLRPALARFFRVTDGLWWHKRVEAEIAEADKRKTSAVAKAQAGGLALAEKRRKQAEEDASSSARSTAASALQAVPQGVLGECPTPSPLPLPSEEREATSDEVARARQAEPPLSLVEKKKPKSVPDCPHIALLALWAEVLPALPQHDPQQWHKTRAGNLRARWRETAVAKGWGAEEDGLTFFRKLFGYIGRSPFLTGRSHAREGKLPFVIELEWLVRPVNWAKVIEGKYHQEAA